MQRIANFMSINTVRQSINEHAQLAALQPANAGAGPSNAAGPFVALRRAVGAERSGTVAAPGRQAIPYQQQLEEWERSAPAGEEAGRRQAVERIQRFCRKFLKTKTLDLSRLGLTTMPDFPAGLVDLAVDDNSLTSLPDLPAGLRMLTADRNQLTSLPDLPAGLRTLTARKNQLTTLPTLPKTMKELGVEDNLLTILPQLPAGLTALVVSDNQLTTLPQLPASLKWLYLGGNPLISLPIANLGNGDDCVNQARQWQSANQSTLVLPNSEASPPAPWVEPVTAPSIQLLPRVPEAIEPGLADMADLPEALYLQQLYDMQFDLATPRAARDDAAGSAQGRQGDNGDLPAAAIRTVAPAATGPAVANPDALPAAAPPAAANRDVPPAATWAGWITRQLSAPWHGQAQPTVAAQVIAPLPAPPRPVVRNQGAGPSVVANSPAVTVPARPTQGPRDWHFAEGEANAAAFNQFQRSLAGTAEYTHRAARPALEVRVDALVADMRTSSTLRATCFAIATEANQSCGDRVALALNDMELAHIDHKAVEGRYTMRQLLDLGDGFFKLHVLDEIVCAKINQLNRAGTPRDEIEIRLAYQTDLAGSLSLPGVARSMLYRGAAAVSAQDISAAERTIRQKLERSESVDFLAQWKPWVAALERTRPAEYERIREFNRPAREAIVTQPRRMTEQQWREAFNRQAANEAAQVLETTTRLTRDFMEAHNIA